LQTMALSIKSEADEKKPKKAPERIRQVMQNNWMGHL
jgi:hypothetical protein